MTNRCSRLASMKPILTRIQKYAVQGACPDDVAHFLGRQQADPRGVPIRHKSHGDESIVVLVFRGYRLAWLRISPTAGLHRLLLATGPDPARRQRNVPLVANPGVRHCFGLLQFEPAVADSCVTPRKLVRWRWTEES